MTLLVDDKPAAYARSFPDYIEGYMNMFFSVYKVHTNEQQQQQHKHESCSKQDD